MYIYTYAYTYINKYISISISIYIYIYIYIHIWGTQASLSQRGPRSLCVDPKPTCGICIHVFLWRSHRNRGFRAIPVEKFAT